MDKLLITAYLDGRPGHEKQTLAVIKALEHLTPVTVVTESPAAGGLAGALPAALLLGLGRQRAAAGTTSELLIGSGRRTHPALLRAKYHRGKLAAAVCSMSPDWLLRSAFDLCLVPAHDDIVTADNIFRTNGPPCLPPEPQSRERERSLILIGGLDPKSHHWDQELTCRQVAALINGVPERNWTISSSPRTPPATSAQLAAQAAAASGRVTFYRAEATPPGWIEEQYRRNIDVWVTADSISMVYEALNAGCRVGVLPVHWRRPGNKLQRSLNQLEQRKLISYLGQWPAGAPLPAAETAFNEAERCAREILRRWWPERL